MNPHWAFFVVPLGHAMFTELLLLAAMMRV